MALMIECPKCKCQIELKPTFASSPKAKEPEPDLQEWIEMAEEKMEAGLLYDKEDKFNEVRFVTELRERYDKDLRLGRTTSMSENQWKTLRIIANKSR